MSIGSDTNCLQRNVVPLSTMVDGRRSFIGAYYPDPNMERTLAIPAPVSPTSKMAVRELEVEAQKRLVIRMGFGIVNWGMPGNQLYERCDVTRGFELREGESAEIRLRALGNGASCRIEAMSYGVGAIATAPGVAWILDEACTDGDTNARRP